MILPAQIQSDRVRGVVGKTTTENLSSLHFRPYFLQTLICLTMTCAPSTHPFCCQDAHCFKRPPLWNACRKDVWFGLRQVRVKNIFPQAAHLNSHRLSVRKRRDCPVTTALWKRRKPLCSTVFLWKRSCHTCLCGRRLRQEASAPAQRAQRSPLPGTLGAPTPLPSKSLHVIYDSEWKEKKKQSTGQDSKDRLGTPWGDSHCGPTVNLSSDCKRTPISHRKNNLSIKPAPLPTPLPSGRMTNMTNLQLTARWLRFCSPTGTLARQCWGPGQAQSPRSGARHPLKPLHAAPHW